MGHSQRFLRSGDSLARRSSRWLVCLGAFVACGCGSSADGGGTSRNEAADSEGAFTPDTDDSSEPASDGASTAPTSVGTESTTEPSEDRPGDTSSSEPELDQAPIDGAGLGEPTNTTGTAATGSSETPSDPSAPDDPQQPPAAQSPTPSAGVPQDEHIWYYVGTQNTGVATNIVNGEEVPVINGVDQNFGTFPWSPDGKQLAQISRGAVVFYELGNEAVITGSYAAAQYKTVRAWIPGFGVLLEGTPYSQPLLGIMQPDGTDIILGEGENRAAPFRVSVSPNGLHLSWSTASEEGGYDIWRTSFVGGVASQPAKLAHYTGSPMLEAVWSPNSEWMAYAISGEPPETGVYFWQAGSDTTQKVSLEGATYTPYLDFSSDGTSFAMNMFDGAPTGDELPSATLAVLSIGPYGPGVTQAVSSSQSPDLIVWASYGNQFFHAPDGVGVLQQLAADGTPLPVIPFEAFHHGSACSLHWLSETEFVYNGCADSSALTFATVRDGSILTTEVTPIALYHLELSPDGNCLVEWDEIQIRTSPANADDYTQSPVATLRGNVSHVAFTPDSNQLVWTEDGTAQYRVELSNCVPSSDAIHFRDSTGEVFETRFVTPAGE